MSRFYLHVSEGEQSIPDNEGFECEGIVADRHEALRVIAELIDSGLWAPNSHHDRLITITDELGNVLDIVALWEITSRLVV